MNQEAINKILERATVSGDPDMLTLASAILEYRLLIDYAVDELEHVAGSGEPWQGDKCRKLAEHLREYGTK